ncbi:hypothetical protein [Umezawaea sp. Da 62-37]|uniref:hypothetical protein n=1 Tax=Umezawaea sp. Da 62-37 TaxID=3075927 RepID=UPI0028F7040C|nr:hypothetical protein [Umezawaea sp. Da 62-37]WNV91711.1 hypothetical protein RM788_26705 [Umezawaea sp. Da 62-37]
MTSLLAGAAALALSAAGVADASIPTPQCTASTLFSDVRKFTSPNAGDQLFGIVFEAKPGTACTMSGSLGDLVFVDLSNSPLPIAVVAPDPANATPAVLVPGSPKVVYLASKKGTGEGYTPAAATFTLPSTAATDRTVVVRWPDVALTGGPARLGYVGEFFG